VTLFRNERQFMNAIASNARELGFRVFHPEISQGSEAGFPDLTIVGHGVVLFIETKGPGKNARITPKQQAWIDALTAAGQTALIAYPDDFNFVMDLLQTAYETALLEEPA